MNRWNALRRCFVAGVVAVGLLAVSQDALAAKGHCCLEDGTCITVLNVETCGLYECVICAPQPCGPAACWAFSPSDEPDEGAGNEADSSASEGETEAESVAEPDDSAVAMDHDAGICIGDPLKEVDSATPPDEAFIPACKNICNSPAEGCARLSCQPCCWLCGGFEICTQPPPIP